jgi:hypothetical protein
VRHGREEEGETGRGRGRILDHEEVLVAELGEVLERLRRPDVVLAEPHLVVVEADLAVVDRCHPVLAVEDEVPRHVRQLGRGVRLEQVMLERARQKIVVDAEEDVALRVPCREERPVQCLAGVAGLQNA